jgi:energy-converting hydrogenase Eha subunit C
MIAVILFAGPAGLVPALALMACGAVALGSACRHLARAISGAT